MASGTDRPTKLPGRLPPSVIGRHLRRGVGPGCITLKEITMKAKRLGNSDLFITPIGFGAWAIGGSGWGFAWGGQDDSDSIAAMNEALDAGINWIDTAAVYGLGHSEEVVGRALEGMNIRPYVFTKCSMVWDEQRQIGHQ